jgi:ABC-type dipeptide/oligopeptide/nickel transport system ATPase subunit
VVDRNKVLIIQVYTKDCTKRGDPEIKPFFHYSKSKNQNTYNVLYFPWATDLLPHEIESNIQNIETLITEERVCFVGFGTSSLKPVEKFCSKHDLEFMLCGGFSNNVDTETNQAYISQSLMAPAIQSEWQVQNGYIPCRIFKNISYGKMGLTNSETVYRLFDRKIIDNLLYGCILDNTYCRKQFQHIRTNFPQIDAILTKLDIDNKNAGLAGNNLSGGQRQVVNIVNGLIQDAKIVIIDEPTNALDPILKKEVIRLIHTKT